MTRLQRQLAALVARIDGAVDLYDARTVTAARLDARRLSVDLIALDLLEAPIEVVHDVEAREAAALAVAGHAFDLVPRVV